MTSNRVARTRKLARLRDLQEQQATLHLQSAAHAVRQAELAQTHAEASLRQWAAWKLPSSAGGLQMARYAMALDAELGALAEHQRTRELCDRMAADYGDSRDAYGRSVRDREVVERRLRKQQAAERFAQEHRESDEVAELWQQEHGECR